MTFIVKTKNKKQEKIVETFLSSLSIGYYSKEKEDAAILKVMKQGRKARLLTANEKITFLRKLKSGK